MGYLNNQVVTVDAILTKKGRELLARGDGSFNITQFALADDEVDYSMYNPNHPSGSAFYGEAIENMPLLEAFPDENQVMKYKLTTLDRGTAKMPTIVVGAPSFALTQGTPLPINPTTVNYADSTSGQVENDGYAVTISDVRLVSAFTGTGISSPAADQANQQTTIGTDVSATRIGTSFSLTGTTVNALFGANSQLFATVTIVGRNSGARVQVPITLTKTGS